MNGTHVRTLVKALIASLLLTAAPCLGQPVENEPLAPGQSRLGVAVQADGTVSFQGEALGKIGDGNAAGAVLSAPSPKRGLIYVNHTDRDWGGLQGSVVDPVHGKVIVKSMLPEDRVRGRGAAERVVQICDPISWSPEEDYAVIVECGEVVENVVVVDLTKGTSRVVEVGNFEKDPCDWQQFAMGEWVSPTVYKVKVIFQENPWADQPCAEDRVYPAYDLLVDARSLEVRPEEGSAPPPRSLGRVRTTTRLNLRQCPDSSGCDVIRTLAAGIDLEVLDQRGDWLQVRDAAGDSGWVHSGYTTAVAASSEAPGPLSRMTSLQLVIALLLLASPLLIGIAVWLLKPPSVLARMDDWNDWLVARKYRVSTSSGFFARYWGRPVLGLAGLVLRGTETIGDSFLRCGVRIAVFLYLAAFVLIATLVLAYLAVVIVVGIAVLVITLWILSKVLSSDDEDEPRRTTWSRGRASSEEHDEERRRELLLRAGARRSKIYRKTGAFSEDQNGRVDEHGTIYKKTGRFSEERVGRIDEEGRVFTRTGPFSEEQAGRIAEDGFVYERSGPFSEDRIGRIDEAGRIHRRTGPFSEEQIGHVEGED